MTLIPKISRLTKLPGLLRHKQEAEEKSKKDRDGSGKKYPSFNMEDENSVHSPDLSEYKIDRSIKEHTISPRSEDENIGKKIDVTI